jgi:predicted oxidoreductase
LAIDDEGGVLDAEGHHVNGLWAVGEAAGMLAPGVGGDSGWVGSLTAVVWSDWRVGHSIRDRDSE